MIDHIPCNSMKAFARFGSNNELNCGIARRYSCNSPVIARRVSLELQTSRNLSCNQSSLIIKPELRRKNYRRVSASVYEPKNGSAKQAIDSVRAYIESKAQLVKCKDIYICDGSQEERDGLLKLMAESEMIVPLKKHENCWLARTDPRDVARVESKTFICTRDKHDVIPRGLSKQSVGKEQVQTEDEGADDEKRVLGALGNWMSVKELDGLMSKRLRGCMAGRTLYVIPFSMGPTGSSLAKVGIQLTDSPYVVVSMHIMTRVSRKVFDIISSRGTDDFIKCFHSVGCPLPLERPIINNWPCNPDQTIISHIPERHEIISYGSGYGGNSLLGKKCFALRLGSIMGRQEGWFAEHMLILGITDPKGLKKYIAAAFPSACGKTNLAMMTPSLPGYKIECVGDDIAWMRFDDNGTLRAINPEAGFFGVAPGTNEASNPNAMKTIERNTIFTNIAETSDGDIYWEGLEHRLEPGVALKDWQNNTLIDPAKHIRDHPNQKLAHANSRFCAPASQCPIIDPNWESPEGVPISAIIFGGRRPEGVPLVYEAFDWSHGVYLGASMRSESTAAAEHRGKIIMHDPFAMRPFFGYNFGHYLDHWLSFGKRTDLNLPKVFHVNWFRKDQNDGHFLWPGFGENCRVLDWICRRVDGQDCAISSPIGWIPKKDSLEMSGLDEQVDMDQLFSIDQQFWLEEQAIVEDYLRNNVAQDLPNDMIEESKKFKARLLLSNKCSGNKNSVTQ